MKLLVPMSSRNALNLHENKHGQNGCHSVPIMHSLQRYRNTSIIHCHTVHRRLSPFGSVMQIQVDATSSKRLAMAVRASCKPERLHGKSRRPPPTIVGNDGCNNSSTPARLNDLTSHRTFLASSNDAINSFISR